MIKLKKIPAFLCICLIAGLTCIKISAAPVLGKQSPGFILTDAEGEETSLSQLTEKPVLLLFVDDSELSGEKLSQIAEIYDYYMATELQIFTIAVGKDIEDALKFQDELWLTYTLYGDMKGEIAQLYNIGQFPKVAILDNKHIVRYVGDYTTDEELRQEIFNWMAEKVFVITARQFEFEPNIITVNKGDRVLIKLLAEDVEHGMYIDGYELFVDQYFDREGEIVEPEKREHRIKPGEMGLLKFVADKTGRFDLRCSVTCAAFHPYMKGWLKVEPNTRFHIGVILSLLLGGLSFVYFSKEKNKNLILGIIPIDWRFELTQYSIIRKIVESRWVPFLGVVFNIFFFTIILVACFVGGISAGNYNFGIMFVWIVWYVLLMMVLVPFFSRIFCGVCPLPIFGEWIQRRTILNVNEKAFGLNKRFPESLRNMWIVNILFMGVTFGNGYFTTRPIASFIMFAVIILAATITALFYRKRTFCLYMCPVGGFQGLYSNISTLEIRSRDKDICKNHVLKPCFVGSKNGYGCPWMQHPSKMKRNTYCGLCLECFKSCSKGNMAINLRAPGLDLLVDDKRGLDETWKNFVMLGCAVVFYVFMMGPWGFLKGWQNAETFYGLVKYIASSSLLSLILLPATFSIFIFLSKWISKTKVSYKKMFINYSYSLVPLGLLTWVAFSFGFLFPNGSYVIAVISDPFAWGWNLFGTAEFPWTPFLTYWMPYLQIISLIFGLIFSIDIACKISTQTFGSKKEAMMTCIPVVMYLIVLTVAFEWLFVGG